MRLGPKTWPNTYWDGLFLKLIQPQRSPGWEPHNKVGSQGPVKHLVIWAIFKIFVIFVISNCKTVYDFCYKKKRFQSEKNIFAMVNDLLQAIRCPLDYWMHQISFFNSNTPTTKPRKQNLGCLKNFTVPIF